MNPYPARVLLATLLLGLPLTGATGDASEPVSIRADEATFRQQEGIGIYRGNAEMEQGQRHLVADRIEVHVDADGEITRLEAEGNPLRMREGEDMRARARHMVYDVRAERIVLTGNALIEQRGRTFSGGRVEYDLVNETVDASGDADERVRMTIPGRKQEREEE